MNRRTFLTGAVCLGAGAGGYALLSDGVNVGGVATALDDATGPPSTETEIETYEFSEARFDTPPFDSLTLYESGAAEVLFHYDHETERFGVAHESLSVLESPFEVWDSPQYEGPKVINLLDVLKEHAPFPSNEFKLGVYFEEAENLYVGNRTARFSLPEEWYDAAQNSG